MLILWVVYSKPDLVTVGKEMLFIFQQDLPTGRDASGDLIHSLHLSALLGEVVSPQHQWLTTLCLGECYESSRNPFQKSYTSQVMAKDDLMKSYSSAMTS